MTTVNGKPPMQTEADRLRAAARVVACREDSCRKPLIWLKNPATGKSVPVDAETVEATDTEYVSGRHVSHFKTCTAPNRFSKGSRTAI
jgi:hypothetical protein